MQGCIIITKVQKQTYFYLVIHGRLIMSSKVTIGAGVLMCLSLTALASPGITAAMMALVAWEMPPHTVAGEDGIKELTSTEKETAVYHPADLDLNWQMVMSKAIAYLAGWQGGLLDTGVNTERRIKQCRLGK